MTHPIATIFGWSEPTLTPEAAAFFRAANPWGFILMGGACQDRTQVRLLVEALQETVRRPALVFVDQEGGRVARLKPPHWPSFPAPAQYGALYAIDPEIGIEACRIGYRLIAHELYGLGVRANCAPVLDLIAPDADAVIGDRAFSSDPVQVAALGKAALIGLSEGGVACVLKHIPGHGLAPVDSHHSLPRIEADQTALMRSIAPFKAIAHAPMAMTAHVVYAQWDEERPATHSSAVIGGIVRRTIGFDGLLISDDLGMGALEGDWWRRAEQAYAAGCDVVLHCSGDIAEMERIAMASPDLEGEARRRARQAEAAAARQPKPLDPKAAWDDLNLYLGELDRT